MTFKSLIFFALLAFLGRALAVPLDSSHLDARSSCNGGWCTRFIHKRRDLSRRLPDSNNDTLSSSSPLGYPTPPAIPSPVISSFHPHCTSSIVNLDSSIDPSSTISDPSLSTPADNSQVTITVTSTVFASSCSSSLSPLNPTQSPVPLSGSFSSFSLISPSPSLSSTTPTSITPPSTSSSTSGFFDPPIPTSTPMIGL